MQWQPTLRLSGNRVYLTWDANYFILEPMLASQAYFNQSLISLLKHCLYIWVLDRTKTLFVLLLHVVRHISCRVIECWTREQGEPAGIMDYKYLPCLERVDSWRNWRTMTIIYHTSSRTTGWTHELIVIMLPSKVFSDITHVYNLLSTQLFI